LLSFTAKVARDTLRATDIVGRLGGEGGGERECSEKSGESQKVLPN